MCLPARAGVLRGLASYRSPRLTGSASSSDLSEVLGGKGFMGVALHTRREAGGVRDPSVLRCQRAAC
jgi:hypothetical protein